MVSSKKLLELTSPFCTNPEIVMAHYLQTAIFISFCDSITPFEEDWRPSQGQQEALLAYASVVVNGSVANEAIVAVDIASASPSASYSAATVKASSIAISMRIP